MDWFTRLTGFKEERYEQTQSKLELNGTRLRSKINGNEFEIGEFCMPSLGELRIEFQAQGGGTNRLKVSIVTGDVRKLLSARENHGALFQVASQFNMLEMISPTHTPDEGVTIYRLDPTQGPACAIAAGAATIYRNYLVPCAGTLGQRADRQLNGLCYVGEYLSQRLAMPVTDLWKMRNGYALCTRPGLVAINALLREDGETVLDEVRSRLRVGIHRNVQVTDVIGSPVQLVSQVFCSALPVAYSEIPSELWSVFARLILEAAYEATLLEGVRNEASGGSNVVFLTRLGGGAFGNENDWIHGAIERALQLFRNSPLDVRIVTYQEPSSSLTKVVQRFV